ncbi:MAG: hypothetical protein JO061_08715 [Acidobacteriaceae bacterium]|nr:hypothetical protein [Acidobacteriaceae bacterium]
MTLSEGSRIFTRYGYADLLKEDRKYSVRYRIFSGTQRILLSADPVFGAAYARSFGFCGASGADVMEPLTCRGRRGSAVPGRRSGYADEGLEPRWDWEKYADWYRVWGRLIYNPDAGADVDGRGLAKDTHARTLEEALACASRILPIVTTAYLPSAACDAYWPEIYWNQPIAAEPKTIAYGDTASPKVFHNASPLDPQLFSSMNEAAEELLSDQRGGKVSPIQVSVWLEDLAETATRKLEQTGELQSASSRRAAIDVRIQTALGRFFAAKFRAGVLYAIHEKKGSRRALEEAVRQYRMARSHWATAVSASGGVYAADLSVSDRFDERGQWADRLQGIDEDIAELERHLESAATSEDGGAEAALAEVLNPSRRERPPCRHTPPRGFRPNERVAIEISLERGRNVASARLLYRHVNQAERFQHVEMGVRGRGFTAEIPAAYTASEYALQYYFELSASSRDAWLYPGFDPEFKNQPYFLLRRS